MKCEQCGADLQPGAASCPQCGKLAAPSAVASGSGFGIVLCILGGIVIGVVAVLLYTGLVASIGGIEEPSRGCGASFEVLGVSVFAVALMIATFVYGVRIAGRNKALASLAITAAIVFLLPVAPCTVATIGPTLSCR